MGLPPPRLLIVDDDQDARALARRLLDIEGFDCTEASTGDQALRLLANHDYDAIVLDRVMPGMDGIEVLQWIRRTPSTRTLPVVMVTARDDKSDVVDGLDLGADDYVTKPYDAGELVARVRSQVRSKSLWAKVLNAEIERRRALMDAAEAVATTTTAESTAIDICAALLTLGDARGAAIIEVVDGDVETIATKGADPVSLLVADRESHALASRLTEHAEGCAWFEQVGADRADRSEPETIVLAPVRDRGEVVAFIAALPAAGSNRETLDHLMAETIDFATLSGTALGMDRREPR